MPSLDHEALVALFRSDPRLAPQLLRGLFDCRLPQGAAETLEADLTQLAPTEYRADLVVAVGAHARIVVEVQLGRDEAKRWSWPLYVAALRARERCPVHLLVVAPRPDVAAWARTTIEMGHPGFRLQPWVLGPDSVPLVTDPDVARLAPELAVLSALFHGAGPHGLEVALAALVATRGLDRERSVLYGDLVLLSLDEVAQQALEALMANGRYEFRSDFARKYFQEGRERGLQEGRERGLEEGRERGIEEGRAQALATAIVAILGRRGIALSAEQRSLILGCTDVPTLDRWFGRALDVDSVDDLLG